MSEIKTAEQRIHKLEGGEGDSFVTVEQALIAERDELRAALAERDAKLAALNGQKSEENIPGLAADESSFIRWAEKEKYDISCHPMFFVMLDEKTYAARMGWKAAKAYYAAAGAAPVPQGRKITATRIANHLKKSPLGDISMYRNGFFDGAKWAAAPKEPT